MLNPTEDKVILKVLLGFYFSNDSDTLTFQEKHPPSFNICLPDPLQPNSPLLLSTQEIYAAVFPSGMVLVVA